MLIASSKEISYEKGNKIIWWEDLGNKKGRLRLAKEREGLMKKRTRKVAKGNLEKTVALNVGEGVHSRRGKIF